MKPRGLVPLLVAVLFLDGEITPGLSEAGFSAPISLLLIYFDEVEDGQQEKGDIILKNELRAIHMFGWPAPQRFLPKNSF